MDLTKNKKCQSSFKILKNTKTLIFFSKDLNLVTLLLDIPRLEWDSNPQKSFGGSLCTMQFLPKRDVFPNYFKVTKNLGFFCKKICCQRLSKTNKSGHTDVLESILFLIFVSLHLRKDLWNNWEFHFKVEIIYSSFYDDWRPAHQIHKMWKKRINRKKVFVAFWRRRATDNSATNFIQNTCARTS